jgi:hypothetical protein
MAQPPDTMRYGSTMILIASVLYSVAARLWQALSSVSQRPAAFLYDLARGPRRDRTAEPGRMAESEGAASGMRPAGHPLVTMHCCEAQALFRPIKIRHYVAFMQSRGFSAETVPEGT